MDEAEHKRLWELIQNPTPGSKLAEAKEYGIDLTLLLENLKLTPTERLQNLMEAQLFVLELRRAKQQAQSK